MEFINVFTLSSDTSEVKAVSTRSSPAGIMLNIVNRCVIQCSLHVCFQKMKERQFRTAYTQNVYAFE